ncbi:cellobiose dehydrogenase-like protein [Sphaerosporella brunnea]|uniref:Cellobiose dehydrogenase-like protein n=1 Tax=Sphaerosporella brunnea TaxID=1250544 RepID=A0A5J5EE87_9PEZI|nr:cellobiose dehydrogenase-like protein [Sphaerosporella brunnea]
MNWKPTLLALAASIGLASAQQSVSFSDPATGINYEGYITTTSAGGYAFGMALPLNPTHEFIGHIEGPLTGWSGVSLGGSMTNSLLVVAWANGNEVMHSFRMTSSYVDPPLYSGNASATTMYSAFNSTHFTWTFRCQNCVSWGDGYGFDPTSDFTVLGWAVSSDAPTDVTDSTSDIPYHDAGMGQYGQVLSSAKFSQYETWINAAGTTGTPTTTTTAVPTSTTTTTSIPSSTQVLGTYDYIVVGGGAGGIVAADRLSETGASVLLIERGPPATYKWGGRIMPSWLQGRGLTRFDVPGLCNEIWVDSAGIACPDYDHMAGCVLGGGTAVNAGMFFVPQDRDWDYNWPSGWQSGDMKDSTRAMFSRIPGTDTPSMDGKRYLQEVYQVVGGAVKNAGWTELTTGINNNANSKCKTFGHSPFMYSNGERGGPLATYLSTASARSNFKLQMNTMVRRIIRSGGTASGVEVYATNTTGVTGIYNLKPNGKLILSAGTWGTAKILFRSGIGPPDMLQIVQNSALDGPTMIDSSQWILSPVGYNVVDHTNTDLVFSHPAIVDYDFYGAYTSPVAADANLYLNSRAGVFSSAAPGIPLVLYDQVNGTDGILRQLQWTARSEGSVGEKGTTLVTVSQYLGTGSQSRGRIVIKSNLDMTVGASPYALGGADKAAIVSGVSNMLRAVQGFTYNGTAITVLQPPAGQTAQQYVDAYVQDRGTNHWLGSARLGIDDGTKTGGTSGSVVDLNTKVYGTANIFVVDGSIFPGLPATNPSAPILVAAEHAIKRILALAPTTSTPPRAQTTITTVTGPSSSPVAHYSQCGGLYYTGSTICASPYKCKVLNAYYSQCL